LETYEKLKLIDGLKVKSYTKGEFAIHQGQQGEEFFIIEKGQCECIKESDGVSQVIRVLGEGDHFGEISVI
jgi:cAMP-dependent protein kinase regulator